MTNEIEKMAKAIMNNEHIDDSVLCTNHKCIRDCHCWGYEIAEALSNEGYHKTIWHKVADGDLPNFINDLIIAIKCNDGVIRTVAGNYRLERFNINDLGPIDTGNVIAWAELPKYEEER